MTALIFFLLGAAGGVLLGLFLAGAATLEARADAAERALTRELEQRP